MSEPAFKKNQVSALRFVTNELFVFGADFRQAGRRSHEFIEPGILELDAGAVLRSADVIGAADKGKGMEMEAVYHLAGHDVDPAIGHEKAAFPQVEFQMGREKFNVLVDLLFKSAKGGGKFVELSHGAIGGVSARITFRGPGAPFLIIVSDLVTFLQKIFVEPTGGAGAQRRVVNGRGKPRLGAHAVML